jgi:hypothetical protein
MTTTTPLWRSLELPAHVDDRGSLSVAEAPHVPFDIRRVYYLYDIAPGAGRGAHATFGSEQILVPVHGGFSIALDDGTSTEKLRLDEPTQALYLGSGVWRDLSDFVEGTVVLVMSSTTYADTEYCREYGAFLERVGSS